jgi:thiol-disulfide isomerase/thioredoxin
MRWSWMLGLFLFGLSACASATSAGLPVPRTSADLTDFGPAPELANTIWLNTPAPLHLSDLRGKVVLLEMWTFECVNCQDVLPTLRGWYQTYGDQGLVIIGNHFPEFPEERSLANLKEAVARLGIPYPVAQDNDGATWRAFASNAWPTLYLIDRRGHIRYVQVGEGNYTAEEAAIKILLAQPTQ